MVKWLTPEELSRFLATYTDVDKDGIAWYLNIMEKEGAAAYGWASESGNFLYAVAFVRRHPQGYTVYMCPTEFLVYQVWFIEDIDKDQAYEVLLKDIVRQYLKDVSCLVALDNVAELQTILSLGFTKFVQDSARGSGAIYSYEEGSECQT